MATDRDGKKKGAARRRFLQTSLLTGAAAVTGAEDSSARLFGARKPEQVSKGIEYVRMITAMVRDLLAGSYEDIGKAADICAEAVIAGSKIYYTVRGHNEPHCILENRSGKPAFLFPTEKQIDPSIFQPGDVLITERTEYCAPAKERGVRLIGILMPFQPQKTRGQGIVHVDYKGPWMEEICDVCIWDRVPYTVGTMPFDQLPIKAVPAHGAMDGIILNLILAGTIDRLRARGVEVCVV